MFLGNTDKILNNTALADAFGRARSYGELEQLSEEYLQTIPERSLVFILCDYHMDTVTFYYCMMNNHVVPLLLDKKIDKEMLENLISIYQPQYVWMEKERVLEFTNFRIVQEYEKHGLFYTFYGQYEMYENLALLLTTSGSTGSPKLVRISNKNLIVNMNSTMELLDICETDRGITVLPMTYCYGLSLLHMHWRKGATIFLNEWPVIHGRFWEYLKRSEITNFQGVPYTYEMLDKIGFLEKQYSSLRFLTQAGAKLPENRQKLFGEKLAEKGIDFFILYGQTEATTYLSGYLSGKNSTKIGSIGKPMAGMRAYLSEAENGIGELAFQSESVALGYAEKQEDLRKKDENHGKLRTGDLAFIDSEGYIFIRGRIKRMIKMLGVRFNLDEIEAMLIKNFSCNEFACAGVDNELYIYYVGELDEDAAKRFCSDKMHLYAQMLHFVRLEKIPRNETGKIAYVELNPIK